MAGKKRAELNIFQTILIHRFRFSTLTTYFLFCCCCYYCSSFTSTETWFLQQLPNLWILCRAWASRPFTCGRPQKFKQKVFSNRVVNVRKVQNREWKSALPDWLITAITFNVYAHSNQKEKKQRQEKSRSVLQKYQICYKVKQNNS